MNTINYGSNHLHVNKYVTPHSILRSSDEYMIDETIDKMNANCGLRGNRA